MKKFDEAGTRTRFLHQYAKLKEKYLFTDEEFAAQIGTHRHYIMLLKKGKRKLDLITLMTIHLNYLEIDINYILFSTEIPEVHVPDLTGANLKAKAGRKRIENPKQPYKPRKKERKLISPVAYATYTQTRS